MVAHTDESSDHSSSAQTAPSTAHLFVRDFWPRYHRQALTITVLVQLALIAAIALVLLLTHPSLSSLVLVITIAGVLMLALNIVLVTILLAPLRDLSAALTHISGEATDVTPPNPNTESYERDGLKPLLGLIYQLASVGSAASDGAINDPQEQAIIAAFNRSKAGIVVMTSDGHITYANQAAPVITDSNGIRSLQLIFDIDQPLDEWRAASVNHLVRSEHTWLRIADRLADDPKRRIFDVIASYEQGSSTEVLVLFVDRTSTYQPEDDQLDFISFAAHELRGPVTVIRGYLDVLSQELGGQISPTHRALIDRLTVSANRLSTYINNILNASRYDRRHLKIHLSEHRLVDIYHTIADDMALRASTQNRLLSVTIPDDLPTVAADPSSISEVFANLIDNALKYSHEGGAVEVTAVADGGAVRVTVTDYGIGMPSNVLRNLFHKFYRSHRSRETVAGTGIGLFISKAVVQSHGGTIEAKSEVGKGSTFTFSLPMYAAVADKLAAAGNTNEAIIRSSSGGWIKNHAKIRG